MSIRFSPDGLYRWDGARWVSTMSPDGRFRWDGAQWVPLPQGGGAMIQASRPPSRQPTSWTRPLQSAVEAWYAIQALYAISLPFWLGGLMSQMMTQTIQREEQLNPSATPMPAGFNDQINSTMSLMMNFGFAIGAIVAIAISAVAIIGAVNRWAWAYYVVLALLGLGMVTLPINLVYLLVGPTLSSSLGFSFPAWFYALGVGIAAVDTGLFIWMLVALVKRGPWAMTKVQEA